jgi:ribulose-phosphate 3-epimerase
MKYIAPSILNAEFNHLERQIRNVELGGADFIHCDIMDGHFVPNITFGPSIVQAIKNMTRLPLDVHLMIDDPEFFLDSFVESGANILTVHQEAVIHLNRTLNRIKELNCKAGVSINPSTPVNILSEVLEIVDQVLIMSVNPGYGGQSFIESSLRRINELYNLRSRLGLKFLIEVDGGISLENIEVISNAGCDVFVIGTHIFGHENVAVITTEFKNKVNSTFI